MTRETAVLALLALAIPVVCEAYASSYTAYDTQSCTLVTFEPSEPDSSGITTVTGYTQRVSGGEATKFTGRGMMSDAGWSFTAEPTFLLAGSVWRPAASGIMECVSGCAAHGVEYVFETSLEDMGSEPIFVREVSEARTLCPSLFPSESE